MHHCPCYKSTVASPGPMRVTWIVYCYVKGRRACDAPSLRSARKGGEPWYSQPPQKTTMSAGYTVPSLVVTPASLTSLAEPRTCLTRPWRENSK